MSLPKPHPEAPKLPRGSSGFSPGQLWTDTAGTPINAHGGGVLHHAGIYYWFGEHKIGGATGNFAQVGVRVYASTNLYDWDDQGVALAVAEDPACELARGCILERPKVIYNQATRQFVMWFHLEPCGAGYTAARSGVAVATAPAGPYRFIGSLRPNAGAWPQNVAPDSRRELSPAEERELGRLNLPGAPRAYYPKDVLYRRDFSRGQMARDMTLFVDHDGTAYHLYASEANGTLHISQLSDDYLAPIGRYIRVLPGRFNEAPAIFAAGGKYFIFASDCTGWTPNPARLLVAGSIWGPWEEAGNPCVGTSQELATTFWSQPAFILPVAGRANAFIYLGDRWCPENPIDGRYVWLPIEFHHGIPMISWRSRWDLGVFD